MLKELSKTEVSALERPVGAIAGRRKPVFDPSDTGVDDAAAVLIATPVNCPQVVAALIERLGARPDDSVVCPDGVQRSLWETLTAHCEIDHPAAAAVEVLASRAPEFGESLALQAIAEGYPDAEPANAGLLGLLTAFPSAQPPVQELVSALALLPPGASVGSWHKAGGA